MVVKWFNIEIVFCFIDDLVYHNSKEIHYLVKDNVIHITHPHTKSFFHNMNSLFFYCDPISSFIVTYVYDHFSILYLVLDIFDQQMANVKSIYDDK